EMYGSSEAGWVTLLRPEEQMTKLGSIGRELIGSAPIRLLDDNGNEVAEGEVGELHSRTPWCFEGYWKLADKTAEAFRGPYLSVGDLARRDAEGYYQLVDRKSNMIISGGENIYPSEIENLLGSHPAVKDVAAIARPHALRGEAVGRGAVAGARHARHRRPSRAGGGDGGARLCPAAESSGRLHGCLGAGHHQPDHRRRPCLRRLHAGGGARRVVAGRAQRPR